MNCSFGKLIKCIALAASLIVPSAGIGQTQAMTYVDSAYTQTWSPFIKPAVLNSMQAGNADVQIIDIRSKKYVKKGVVPGAVWMPFSQWRGPKSRPGQPPTEEALEALLGAHGLDLEKPIIVHNHSGRTVQTGRAAIVYWLLKSGGAEKVAILNGGFKAWKASELPIAAEPYTRAPTTVDVTYRYDWWADPVDIFGVASGQSEGAILDARLDGHVKKSIETGKPLQSMPTARFIPASFFTNPLSEDNLSDGAQGKFTAELVERGIDLGDGFLISVCQTGELSALSWFYASEIVGLENVLFYPDALQGWKSDGGAMFGLNPS